MSIPNEPEKLKRFIQEFLHESARDEEIKETLRDFISAIVDKWEEFKDEYLSNFEPVDDA